jgi:hypothetical protein
MEDLPAFRRRLCRTGWTGLVLLALFIVPLAVSALKSSYANKVLVLGDIAAGCYHSFGWIKTLWSWPVFPVFSLSDGFGFGNIIAVVYLLGVIVGVIFLLDWWNMLKRLERLRHDAGDDNLRRGF